MTIRPRLPELQRIEYAPVTQEELGQLRGTCERIMAGGGELGEIASDMLRASDGLTAFINKIDAFLKS